MKNYFGDLCKLYLGNTHPKREFYEKMPTSERIPSFSSYTTKSIGHQLKKKIPMAGKVGDRNVGAGKVGDRNVGAGKMKPD